MLREIDKEDVRLLTDVGFLALSYGDLRSATTIFNGVQIARPDGEAGPLGLALAALAKGDVGDALEILSKLPPTDPVQLYLAIALWRSGDRQAAEDLFNDLKKTANGTPYGDIAEEYLKNLQNETPIL